MAYNNPQKLTPETLELRKQCGRWIKGLREKTGRTQLEVSKIVGYDYYTFVSQVELGHGRIPPEQYEAWAQALNMHPYDFIKTLLRYYDPPAYKILFKIGPPTP